MLQLCDDDVVNKLLSFVTLLVVMIEKWLTAVFCMQTTQVQLNYLYYPLLLALFVPIMQRVSDFIAAFGSLPLQSPAHLTTAGSQLEFTHTLKKQYTLDNKKINKQKPNKVNV